MRVYTPFQRRVHSICIFPISTVSESLFPLSLPTAAPQSNGDFYEGEIEEAKGKQNNHSNSSLTALGPLTDTERRDLNCGVKEYLLLAGYRLTAMTFYQEVHSIHSSLSIHFITSTNCIHIKTKSNYPLNFL